jgi:hypothetical protein
MKHLKLFLEYITINQGANLATNNSPKQFTFDGGDGPSSTEINPTHRTVKTSKIKRGSDIKKKKKKKNRANKINNSSPILTNSNSFGNNGQGNSPGGGGADYTLQGF